MYEDAHLESQFEDRFAIEDETDFDARDFDSPDEFFDDDPEWEEGFIQEYDRP